MVRNTFWTAKSHIRSPWKKELDPFPLKKKFRFGRKSANKFVLLNAGSLRGEFNGSGIVPASLSGPQRALFATCWRPVLADVHFSAVDRPRLGQYFSPRASLSILRYKALEDGHDSPNIFSRHLGGRYNYEFLQRFSFAMILTVPRKLNIIMLPQTAVWQSFV